MTDDQIFVFGMIAGFVAGLGLALALAAHIVERLADRLTDHWCAARPPSRETFPDDPFPFS